MVESLIAIAVTAIAGGALLTSLGAAIQSSSSAAEMTVARGLADQMMDEILSARFPTSSDVRAIDGTRAYFDDLDDYDKWSSRPPTERSGIVLGQDGLLSGGTRLMRMDALRTDSIALVNFTREVLVEPSSKPDGFGGWQVTGHRDRFSTDYRPRSLHRRGFQYQSPFRVNADRQQCTGLALNSVLRSIPRRTAIRGGRGCAV